MGVTSGLIQQAAYNQSAANRNANYSEYTAAQIDQSCTVVTKLEKPVCVKKAAAEHRLQARDKQREYDDLAAQQTSALWTSIMGIAALIGMGFSAVGVALVYITFRETRRSADAGHKTYDIALAAHRPWISITLHLEGAQVVSGLLQIDYRIGYKNIGQTVAQFFVPKHIVEITGGAFKNVITEFQIAAREQDSNHSRVLMPNEIYNHSGRKSYDLGKMVWVGKRKRRFLAVSASAFYNLPGEKWGETRRHTERTFLIVTEDTSGRPEQAIFRSRLPVEGHVRLQIKDAAPRSAS